VAKDDKSQKSDAPVSKPSGGMSTTTNLMLAAAVAVTVAAGIYAYRGGFSGGELASPNDPKSDPEIAELMKPGPLPEMVMGSADAPNTIVEYASMTCPHCALFQKEVLPELKTKYIDTGKAKYILREFPLDGLALAAFMVARCSGDDRYYPMVDALFETQDVWAVTGNEGKEKLLLIARQSGMSKEEFDKCLADKAMFDKIVETRKRANEVFGVDSTPSFFVNGKRLGTEHTLKDFEAILEPDKAAETPASPAPAPAGQ
jgi:protein-disulfide isomerase